MSEKYENRSSSKSPESKQTTFESDSSFKTEINSLFATYLDVECGSENEETGSYDYKDLLLSANRDLCTIGISAKAEKVQSNPEDLVDGLSEIMFRKYNLKDSIYPESEADSVDDVYQEAFSRVFPEVKINATSLDSFQETLNSALGDGLEVELPDSLNLYNSVGINKALDIADYYLGFNAQSLRSDNFLIETENHSDEGQLSVDKYYSKKEVVKNRIEANYKLGLFVDSLQKRKKYIER